MSSAKANQSVRQGLSWFRELLYTEHLWQHKLRAATHLHEEEYKEYQMRSFQTTSLQDVPLTRERSGKKRSLLQGLLALALLLMVSAAGISFFSPAIGGTLPRLASNLADSISPITTICHGPDNDPAHGHYVADTTVTAIVQPGENALSNDHPIGTLTMMLDYCPRYNSFFARLSFHA